MEKRTYHVPQEDGGVLLEPPRDDLPDQVRANAEALRSSRVEMAGLGLGELRRAARTAATSAAREYMGELGLAQPPDSDGPLVVTGHQPHLYHPGIWLKNFLARWLAGRVGGAALNLVVDNDEARHLSVSVPVRREGRAEKVEVPLGGSRQQLPYEEWELPDPAAARRFCDGVLEHLAREDMREAFADFSRHFVEGARQWPDVATLMTAARCRYEARFDLVNLELPLSRLCETEPFAHFFAQLVAELPRFVQVYNQALALYRRVHRIRNLANPLPDLAEGEGWLEAPFWVWRSGEPRRALRVGLRGEDRTLVDGGGEMLRLSEAELGDGGRVAGRLRELRGRGYKVRTRALTTTLFARLCLGDTFIHGTGGGNYDQITDHIIRDFFAVEPPGYVVASATVCLPFARESVSREEVTRRRWLIRDLHYNPDRHLTEELREDPEVKALVARKWDFIGRRGETSFERRGIFVTIRKTNADLEARLGDAPQQARRDLEEARLAATTDAVLGSREYAYCLFPQGLLRDFYRRVLP